MQRMETTPFVTVSQAEDTQKQYRRYGYGRAAGRKVPPQKAGKMSLMFLKIGVCVGVCALMLALKSVDSPLASKTVETVGHAVTEETDIDEMLGKLQFVELPNILEVFAQSNTYAAPVSVTTSTPLDDGRMLLLTAQSGADVSSACRGSVYSIGTDASLGDYVCVKKDTSLEFYYYGLAEIFVEEGQPVRAMDTLGALGADGCLYLAVLENGRPMDPREYIDFESNR